MGQSQGFNSCGRRKRQANFGGSTSPGGAGAGGQDLDGEERFFLPTGQGCTCNSGRRRRQEPGEDEPGTRIFGGLFGGTPHCGSCCYNSQPFNNNGLTATSRTREDSTTREVSTARALTRTRVLTTRTTESAN